jgi:glutaconate CoA-transferase subunit B
MSHEDYSTSEIMTVAAARMLRDGAVCFVGIGLPSKAANLARLTHARNAVLIYESGPIGSKPHVLPLRTIRDGRWCKDIRSRGPAFQPASSSTR